jgi:putative hydrolase
VAARESRRDPVADLRSIAFLLERNLESTYRVRAYRGAANALEQLGADEVKRRAADGTLTKIKGVGDKTAAAVGESLRGDEPAALTKLRQIEPKLLPPDVAELRALLRGDCHSHSDWSDGGSPIREMAMAARDLGHEYLVLTDHSPRLTVANGLSVERLEQQLDVVAEVNDDFAVQAASGDTQPFRLLTGIEVDINEDGTLDQKPSLLERLDVVVASVHSKLRMPAHEMTPRMIAAISNPHTDVLGHCTGRMVMGARGTRPPSEFDAEIVFAACAQFGVAVEINSRPERMDPPNPLLKLAIEAGCLFSIDTDAHAPGQLDWQTNGCEKAVECDVDPARIVNTRDVDGLLAWTADHGALP